MDAGLFARFLIAHRAKFAEDGVLGGFCGTSLASWLRRAGLEDIRRKEWLVERWAPLSDVARGFVVEALRYWGSRAAAYDLSATDLAALREIAANPSSLIDDPDFCFREFFVVAVGRVPAAGRGRQGGDAG